MFLWLSLHCLRNPLFCCGLEGADVFKSIGNATYFIVVNTSYI